MYNGNEDLNLVLQVKLMVKGKGKYTSIYQMVQTVITDKESDKDASTNAPPLANLFSLLPYWHMILISDMYQENTSLQQCFSVPQSLCQRSLFFSIAFLN